MLSLCILNLMKMSLKNLYDIEPLVVDHILVSVKLNAMVLAVRSSTLVEGATQIVREAISAVRGNESALV